MHNGAINIVIKFKYLAQVSKTLFTIVLAEVNTLMQIKPMCLSHAKHKVLLNMVHE